MSSQQQVPRLMLVTDRRRCPRPLDELCQQAVHGGVDAIQIRERDLAPADLRALASHVLEHTPKSASVLVNGAINIASDLRIGVHLPEDGPSPDTARRVLGSQALIGRSVHSAGATIASVAADYVIAGHVFPTASKREQPPLGLDGLRKIVAASPVPVIAIGGITERNVQEVMPVGAHGIAVISAISQAEDPAQVATALRSIIDRSTGELMNSKSETVNIIVNGKETPIGKGLAVAEFLADRGLRPKLVVVELNGTILDREDFASTTFSPGDRVEVVHFVGGG